MLFQISETDQKKHMIHPTVPVPRPLPIGRSPFVDQPCDNLQPFGGAFPSGACGNQHDCYVPASSKLLLQRLTSRKLIQNHLRPVSRSSILRASPLKQAWIPMRLFLPTHQPRRSRDARPYISIQRSLLFNILGTAHPLPQSHYYDPQLLDKRSGRLG